MTAPTEIEAKFSLDDPARGDALASADALAPGIALGAVTERVDHDDYADGAALPLLRAGWVLRHRTRFTEAAGRRAGENGENGGDGGDGDAGGTGDGEGWPTVKHIVTLKQLSAAATAAAGDAVHTRAEYEGAVVGAPFDPAAWPDAVRAAAEAACGGALPPLEALFTLVQRRRVRDVTVDGAAAGELSIDTVRVHLAGGARSGADAVARFDEVEFELAPGGDLAMLARVVPALAAACGGAAAVGSKFDTAIARLAAAPAVADMDAAERSRLAAALAALGRPARDGA